MCNMKDTDTHDNKQSPGENDPDSPQSQPMAFYSAEQRRRFRKGLRILARVAVRARMRREAALNGTAVDDDGETPRS